MVAQSSFRSRDQLPAAYTFVMDWVGNCAREFEHARLSQVRLHLVGHRLCEVQDTVLAQLLDTHGKAAHYLQSLWQKADLLACNLISQRVPSGD